MTEGIAIKVTGVGVGTSGAVAGTATNYYFLDSIVEGRAAAVFYVFFSGDFAKFKLKRRPAGELDDGCSNIQGSQRMTRGIYGEGLSDIRVCVCVCSHERVRMCVVWEGGDGIGVLVCVGGAGVSRRTRVWAGACVQGLTQYIADVHGAYHFCMTHD